MACCFILLFCAIITVAMGNKKKKYNFKNPPRKLIKNEPKPICTICEKEIELISIAISDGNEGYQHFDCVLKKLGENKALKKNQKISYVGKGNFALVEKNEGKWTLLETFNLESPEVFSSQKKYVEELTKPEAKQSGKE